MPTRIGGLPAVISGDAKVVQTSANVLAWSSGKKSGKFTRAEGWIASGNSVIGARNFSQSAPAGLVASGGRLAVELLAGEAAPQLLQGSRDKTWEIFVRRDPDAAAAAGRAQHPLRLTIDPIAS